MTEKEQAVTFRAPETQVGGQVQWTSFTYRGGEDRGWEVLREGEPFINLGPGYVLIRGVACGICSTDLARPYLPYPLPQVIGHEVVGELNGQWVTFDINSSHAARGLPTEDCPWCSAGLATHCPQRITLGIDRQPGGFAPWMLMPRRGIHPLPEGWSWPLGTLVEPFSAALHGVERSLSSHHHTVAVLGPRKLGLLTLAALKCWQRQTGRSLRVTALTKHEAHYDLSLALGADEVIVDPQGRFSSHDSAFDVVFDTTGSPTGLGTALKLSRGIVHLKSTHGQKAQGLQYLTEFVVGEYSLKTLAAATASDLAWPGLPPQQEPHIWISPGVSREQRQKVEGLFPGGHAHVLDKNQALEFLKTLRDTSGLLPRFSAACLDIWEDLDSIIQTGNGTIPSLLAERGTLFWSGSGSENPLQNFISQKNGELHSSRCGDFQRGIKALSEDSELRQILEKHFISEITELANYKDALQSAADSRSCVKIILKTGG